MDKTRVLVVDDSVLMRTTISHVLGSDPELEVAGVAANGRIALAKMAQLRPDVVTLDFEMPEMDGMQTLAALQAAYPSVPVIMLSSLTMSGAAETLEALSRGASDYVAKPKGGDPASALDVLASELIPKIKIHAARRSPHPARAAAAPPPAAGVKMGKGAAAATAVCIGTSTGGPNALSEVLRVLPAGLPVPVLIVQHMPPMFTRLLAERLTAQCALPVQEGAEGMRVEPGQGYLAPGGFHMEVRRDGRGEWIHLHENPPENSCRPAVDVLFRSAAAVYGRELLAVVLTGMGQDGMRGCQAVKAAGGAVLVQDEATSVVWGMPRAVYEAGLQDAVFPLGEMGGEILGRLRPSGAVPAREGSQVR